MKTLCSSPSTFVWEECGAEFSGERIFIEDNIAWCQRNLKIVGIRIGENFIHKNVPNVPPSF
jgi:hypothetical protein